MVSYQHWSDLCYRKIHLVNFICNYCTLIYNEYVVLLCLVMNNHKTLPISQILNQFLCLYFVTQRFAADKYIYNLPNASITYKNQTLKNRALSGIILLLWGRLWLWFQLFGFSDYWAIHYCNKPVLAIALDLKMTYSVFWLLILFWEAPW